MHLVTNIYSIMQSDSKQCILWCMLYLQSFTDTASHRNLRVAIVRVCVREKDRDRDGDLIHSLWVLKRILKRVK